MSLGSGQGGTFETIPAREMEADCQPTIPKGLVAKAASQGGLGVLGALSAITGQPTHCAIAQPAGLPF